MVQEVTSSSVQEVTSSRVLVGVRGRLKCGLVQAREREETAVPMFNLQLERLMSVQQIKRQEHRTDLTHVCVLQR